MRILFMGTPDIAAESLAALLAAGATLPIFVFNRRAFSLTRRRKNVK